MSTIEEKLRKYQQVCEDKVRKNDALKKVFEANELKLEQLQATMPDPLHLALLNLQLAEIQYQTGKNILFLHYRFSIFC
jgi:hypothetical protein